MKVGEIIPRGERENRGRTERDIYLGKGGSLTVIVGWEAIVQTARGEIRKERSKKVTS